MTNLVCQLDTLGEGSSIEVLSLSDGLWAYSWDIFLILIDIRGSSILRAALSPRHVGLSCIRKPGVRQVSSIPALVSAVSSCLVVLSWLPSMMDCKL